LATETFLIDLELAAGCEDGFTLGNQIQGQPCKQIPPRVSFPIKTPQRLMQPELEQIQRESVDERDRQIITPRIEHFINLTAVVSPVAAYAR
jgi:hypothetical protein